METKKKVVLINPAPWASMPKFLPKEFPLALLSVASTLVEYYNVVLCDRAVSLDDSFLTHHLNDPDLLCIGLSVLTGPSILDGIYCSRLIRQIRPEIAIVWGGWHATQSPYSFLGVDYVDYLVIGDGENIFPKLLTALQKADPTPSIPGILPVNANLPNKSELLPLADLNTLPSLPFHLIHNVEPYIIHNWIPDGNRCLSLETSRGCPYQCTFCDISKRFGISYLYYSPQRIVSELLTMQRAFNLGGIRFYDPNFFLQINRVREFCHLLLDQGIKIKWGADGTIMQFRNISLEDLRLFQQAGLSYVSFGVETGNEQIRKKILNKKFTNIQFFEVAKKFEQVNLNFKFNIMLGLPGETMEDSMQTIHFTMKILDNYKKASIGSHMYLYIPLPGTSLFSTAVQHGFKEPKTLDEYASLSSETVMPWLDQNHQRKLAVISVMSFFLISPEQDSPLTGIKRFLFSLARPYYKFRFKYGWFFRSPDIILLQHLLKW